VTPANATHLTLSDVQHHAVLDDNIHHAPTRLICLENTLGGAVLPLADVQAISAWAWSHGIATHLDGARLWDAVAALCAEGEFDGDLKKGLRAYTSCFDSVTVCFSKGLGAPIGSVLVGSVPFIKKARHIRKMVGGGVRMSGVLAGPATTAVQETFFGGKLTRAHLLARKLERGWISLGGRVAGGMPTNEGGKRVLANGQRSASDKQSASHEQGAKHVLSTNMVWLDIKGSGVPDGVMATEARNEGLQGYWDGDVLRVGCHYQTADDAVERLLKVFERVLAQRQNINGHGHQAPSIGTGFSYGDPPTSIR
jgi:threonine aldolase